MSRSACREKLGISMRQLAQRAGLCRETIEDWSRRHSTPSLRSLLQIHDRCGIPMQQLFDLFGRPQGWQWGLLGSTREDAARQAGVAAWTLQRWEKGVRPLEHTLARVAAALGREPDEIRRAFNWPQTPRPATPPGAAARAVIDSHLDGAFVVIAGRILGRDRAIRDHHRRWMQLRAGCVADRAETEAEITAQLAAVTRLLRHRILNPEQALQSRQGLRALLRMIREEETP